MSLHPYVFPSVPSPQVKAAQEYLKYISEFDFERLSNLLTDDFTLTMSPVNMGVPPKTKAEEFSVLKGLQTKLDGKPLALTVYDVNDGQRKTWVHAKIDTLGFEIVYCFQFGEGPNAHKIASVRDFVDSKTYIEVNSTAPSSST